MARAWTGVWALLAGRPLPAALPPAGAALLREVRWEHDEDWVKQWMFDSFDDPQGAAGIRSEVEALARTAARHPRLA